MNSVSRAQMGLFLWLLLIGSFSLSCGDEWDCGDRCMLGGRCVDGLFCKCPAGTEQCDSYERAECVALDSDPENCGGCGERCAEGLACVSGQCEACPQGATLCDHFLWPECAFLERDQENCGACGDECDDDLLCIDGVCGLDCEDGLAFCAQAGTCVDLQSSSAHCGGCGQMCPEGGDTACEDGACACLDAGRVLCGDRCADLGADEAHCGACDTACDPFSTCLEGACACPDDVTVCGDDCSDLVSDVRHCGACGVACAEGEVCAQGVCSCPEPRAICGDVCVPLGETAHHCGACNQACDGPCSGGECGRVRAVSVGAGLSCALLHSGDVTCWGSSAGAPDAAVVAPVGLVPLPEAATSIAVGDWHACALMMSGEAWCWGRNDKGQLGRGARSSVEPPGAVVTVVDAVELASGGDHVCARKADGRVLCWGQAPVVADEPGRPTPAPLTDEEGVQALILGGDSTCQIFDAGGGDLECFGAIESLTNSLFFVDEFATLAWGWTHGCLIEEGAVKCFGKCDGGACGRRTRSPTHRVPAVVDGVIGPSDAVAGGEHSCAIDQDGVVWCWGGNTLGQLGRGTVEEMGEAALPAAVPEPVIGLAGGLAYTCAFNDTGVWCWGQGENGQLGDGAAADSATPVEVIWW